MAHDEGMLVAQATDMGFEDFYRALSYWKQLADPQGAEEADEERKASRNVFLESSFTGMWLGQMTLDPVSGSIVAGELNRLEHDLFEADCAEAKEHLGRTARIGELARTSAQRRADALVEMATRSRTTPADGIRPAPLFSVLVGYETLRGRICELDNGTVLPPSALAPWMDSAYFERAIFSLGNRVDVSVRARLFSGGRAGRSSCGTASAPTRTATNRRTAVRPITSRLIPRAASPRRRTGGCSAGSTTACATRGINSASAPRRRRRDGVAADLTRPEHHPGRSATHAKSAPHSRRAPRTPEERPALEKNIVLRCSCACARPRVCAPAGLAPQGTPATSNRYPRSSSLRSDKSACRLCHAPLARSFWSASMPRAMTPGSARARPEQLARTAGSR